MTHLGDDVEMEALKITAWLVKRGADPNLRCRRDACQQPVIYNRKGCRVILSRDFKGFLLTEDRRKEYPVARDFMSIFLEKQDHSDVPRKQADFYLPLSNSERFWPRFATLWQAIRHIPCSLRFKEILG